MSLATRCTSCGTVFRVVQDQLKVSEGWVRCGRCNEVFNALEGLFDLERDAPAEWSTPAPRPSPSDAAPIAADPDEPREHDDPSLVDKIDAQLLSPRRTGFGSLAALPAVERRHDDFADARFDTDVQTDSEGADLSILPDDVERPTPPEEPTPEFVRQAQSQERWRSSRARALLFVAAGLLVGALAAQVVHQFRERIAAHWPGTQPALFAWCEWIACTLDAPRRIDEVSVESTALTRSNAAPDAFLLSVVLRNRAATSLSIPWVDLSLTDAAGQLVARRMLGPRDFRASASALVAGSELPLQLTLAAGNGRVTGYTVEIFYP